MSTALVTGGAGFIGSHVVDTLVTAGFDVLVVDNLYSGQKKNLNSKARFYEMDICSPELEKVFSEFKIDWVFHLAAQIDVRKSVDDPQFDARTNIIGLLNLLENCRRHQVRGVVFASSGGAIYGESPTIPVAETTPKTPLSPYAVAKLTSENYLHYYYRVHGLPYIALRYGNVYGPRQSIGGEAGVIAIFIGRMLGGETSTIFGDGDQLRDYVYVGDVARANLLALDKLQHLPPANSLDDLGYNIGTGIGTSVNELYARLQEITGFTGKAVYAAERKGELRKISLDIRKAGKELSWKPSVSLFDGMKKTADFWSGAG